MWTILLEMPPVAKGRPRFSTRGGVVRSYTPHKTASFEAHAKELMRKQFVMQPLPGPVRLSIEFIFKKPQKPKHQKYHVVRPDLDNLTKSVTDAGNGVLWEDDSQIAELIAKKLYAVDGTSPRIVLFLERA